MAYLDYHGYTFSPFLNVAHINIFKTLVFKRTALKISIIFFPFGLFILYWVQPIHNAVIVSGESKGAQPHTYMYPFSPQTPPSYNL